MSNKIAIMTNNGDTGKINNRTSKHENIIPEEISLVSDAGALPWSENFSLSNYEDDDDDSGFYCPCCLPR